MPDAKNQMAGAVRLDDPMLTQAHQFLTDFVASGGNALVIIGMTNDGRIALTAAAPGGQIQVLGMLMKTISIVGGQQQPAPSGVPALLRPA